MKHFLAFLNDSFHDPGQNIFFPSIVAFGEWIGFLQCVSFFSDLCQFNFYLVDQKLKTGDVHYLLLFPKLLHRHGLHIVVHPDRYYLNYAVWSDFHVRFASGLQETARIPKKFPFARKL